MGGISEAMLFRITRQNLSTDKEHCLVCLTGICKIYMRYK